MIQDNLSRSDKLYNHCPSCGVRGIKGHDRCPACHAACNESRFGGAFRVGAGGIGYSDKIDDPKFNAKRKFRQRLMIPLSLGIGLLTTVVLAATKVNMGAAVFMGILIFLVFLIPLLLTFRKKKSWEGTVVKKEFFTSVRHRNDRYIIIFDTEEGKKKKVVFRTYTNVYDYLNEGDRARFVGSIGSIFAFEKYDKSKDSVITCASCGNFRDPRDTYCSVCGCPLLKGNPVPR